MNDSVAIVLGQTDLELLYAVTARTERPAIEERSWLRAQRDWPVQELPRDFVATFQSALHDEIIFGADLTLARRAGHLAQRLAEADKAR